MKVCNRCKIEKEDSEFRVRREKRKRKPFDYLNNECRQCDKERAAIYYAKKRNDESYMEKNRQRVRKYQETNCEKIKMRRTTKDYLQKHAKWELNRYHKMKDVISAKMKVKRQTPEYKKMMKNYRKKNKEKIKRQEDITKKRYHEKHRDSVTDEYVVRQLVSQGFGAKEELEKNTNLIEIKRIKILNRRVKQAILKNKKLKK